jgi:hypothetical protein
VHPKWHPQRRWLDFEDAAAAGGGGVTSPGWFSAVCRTELKAGGVAGLRLALRLAASADGQQRSNELTWYLRAVSPLPLLPVGGVAMGVLRSRQLEMLWAPI